MQRQARLLSRVHSWPLLLWLQLTRLTRLPQLVLAAGIPWLPQSLSLAQ